MYQDEVHLEDCFAVPKEQLEEATLKGSMPVFDQSKRTTDQTFKLNAKTRKTHFKNEPLYPECLAHEDWNTKDIQGEILKWKNSIMRNEDLLWFHDSSSEPLDPSNPKIQITFDQLVDRKQFEKLEVILMSFQHKDNLRQYSCNTNR